MAISLRAFFFCLFVCFFLLFFFFCASQTTQDNLWKAQQSCCRVESRRNLVSVLSSFRISSQKSAELQPAPASAREAEEKLQEREREREKPSRVARRNNRFPASKQEGAGTHTHPPKINPEGSWAAFFFFFFGHQITPFI
jgi:hypothetical protein